MSIKDVKPTMWLEFLKYILLPFCIISNIFMMFNHLKIIELIVFIIMTIYSIITLYLLIKRKEIAYYLLQFFIVISLIPMIKAFSTHFVIKDITKLIIISLIGIIVWIIPNWIYIKKRKKLFQDHSGQHIKKCPGCNRIIPINMVCCGKCNYKE